MFKKIQFQVADGNCVDTMEDKNVSIDDVIRLLKNPNVINMTVTKMTAGQYLKSKHNQDIPNKTRLAKCDNDGNITGYIELNEENIHTN